jgi:drug/metabolite transporter, DME family
MLKSLPGKFSAPALGIAAIALAAGLWAIAASVASELFRAGVSPFELAAARAVVAAIGLGMMRQLGQPAPLKFRDWQVWALGLSLALVTISYYMAIDRLAVAVAVVIQYTAPVLVVIWTMLKSWRIPSGAVVLASIATLIGVVLLSEVLTQQVQFDRLGLVMACLSAIFFAAYTLFSEAIVARSGALSVMFQGFTVSSLFWVAFQVSQGFPTAIFHNLPGVLFVGIGGTLIPFWLYCWGIGHVQAERASIAATLEPVIAAVIAWIWLDQTLTPLQIVGGILVLGAVVFLQLQQSER